MTDDGRSVLAIPVPDADPLLQRAAQQSEAAGRGLPAHISLLYPFLPAPELDEQTIITVAELIEQQPELEVRFERCHSRGGFVFLRPEPTGALSELIGRLRRRWPHVQPYGGRFGDEVEAHLTVAMDANARDSAALVRAVEQYLPLTVRLTEAWLAAFTGRWRLLGRFRFQTTEAASG